MWRVDNCSTHVYVFSCFVIYLFHFFIMNFDLSLPVGNIKLSSQMIQEQESIFAIYWSMGSETIFK